MCVFFVLTGIYVLVQALYKLLKNIEAKQAAEPVPEGILPAVGKVRCLSCDKVRHPAYSLDYPLLSMVLTPGGDHPMDDIGMVSIRVFP